jgi:small acid-soluble spore protein F (minor alpha/beta-type SASP)
MILNIKLIGAQIIFPSGQTTNSKALIVGLHAAYLIVNKIAPYLVVGCLQHTLIRLLYLDHTKVTLFLLEAMVMARRGVMSEAFKVELAKELGFYDVVQREGWGGIKSRDAGNMVKRAIQLAEEQLAKQQKAGE